MLDHINGVEPERKVMGRSEESGQEEREKNTRYT
jgi:hypothetical protein